MTESSRARLDRRAVLTGAAMMAATPALAQECRLGPPPHQKGPLVWMNMDQVELDAAYDQRFYAPLASSISKRNGVASDAVRARIGQPRRVSYGPTQIEKLDIFQSKQSNAPIFVFIHGGAWRVGSSRRSAFPAELFVDRNAHYVALDFVAVTDADGNLQTMADQVRRGIAWVYKNAKSFSGDPERLYIGGFSSGGHLCGAALVTDWRKDFGLPENIVKGGLCMSGIYDMKPVRLSARSTYVKFTDEIEQAMSTQRHLHRIVAPVTVTYGTDETPEFQRQNRDFAAAMKAAGKPVTLVTAQHYNHFEMGESIANPYGPNGRAAIAMMKL